MAVSHEVSHKSGTFLTNLNESTIEHHAIALFQELGYPYAHGPDVSPDGNQKEREDYETDL